MEFVLGLGKQLVEGRDVAGTGADGQGRRRIGTLPQLEGQALGKRGRERGIHGIGSWCGSAWPQRSVWRPWFDLHDIQPGVIRSDRQVEVVEAGGLQADAADLGPRPCSGPHAPRAYS